MLDCNTYLLYDIKPCLQKIAYSVSSAGNRGTARVTEPHLTLDIALDVDPRDAVPFLTSTKPYVLFTGLEFSRIVSPLGNSGTMYGIPRIALPASFSNCSF